MPVPSPAPVELLARFLAFKIIKIKNYNASPSGRAF